MASKTLRVELASTPDPALSHDSRANEIAQLPDYLQVVEDFPDGTVAGIIMEDSEEVRAANTDKLYAVINTEGVLTGFKAYNNDGDWVFLQLSSDNLAAGSVLGPAIAAAGLGGGLEKVTDEEDEDYQKLRAKVDDSTVEINGSGQLGVKAGGIVGSHFGVLPVLRTSLGDTAIPSAGSAVIVSLGAGSSGITEIAQGGFLNVANVITVPYTGIYDVSISAAVTDIEAGLTVQIYLGTGVDRVTARDKNRASVTSEMYLTKSQAIYLAAGSYSVYAQLLSAATVDATVSGTSLDSVLTMTYRGLKAS